MYKLLIVDDEPLTREYMRQNIPSIDSRWEVCGEAEDGLDALEFLSENKVDLVITDIKMPVMDGLELSERISKDYPYLKVIILSGYDEFSFAQEAMHYGVNDYLLKPLVKQELQASLDKITIRIENEQNKELALKAVSNLSNEYKNQIAKNVLKAVITNSNVEIKALYPLLFKLKFSIIEAEGVIMLLSLDKDRLLQKLVPPGDISIFNYILDQVASEVVGEMAAGYVFPDIHENIAVFLSGESGSEVIDKCIEVYSRVASFFFEHTGITISGSVGSPQTDLLQMNASYNDAVVLLQSRVFSRGNAVFKYDEKSSCGIQLTNLEKSVSAIKSVLLYTNDVSYHISILNFVELLGSFDASDILRYGIFLIDSIKEIRKDCSAELIESAYKTLQGYLNEISQTKDKVIQLYNEIVKIFSEKQSSARNNMDDQNIAVMTKDFIYRHFPEPISLAQIAEHLGVSSSYLSSVFHKCAGESYIKFLTRVRMEQAAALLKEQPPLRIYDISEKVGYVSVKHFSYVFKLHYGITPGEFQNKHINF